MKDERRRDYLTAMLIDAAMHSSAKHGIKIANDALTNHGVDKLVIMRVLSGPRCRRAVGYRFLP